MPKTFLVASLALAVALLASRGVTALSAPDIVDWDETYYASITATAANGLGLYPYVMGYPSIPGMGGIGHVVLLYALAYKVLGPGLFALRLVSFFVSLIGVAGLFVLTRRLYGAAAGLAALALAPALLVFERSNSIRLDVFAMAFAAWALVLYAHVIEARRSAAWHALVGLVFALGLEVHLHTAAAAFAVGFAYLVDLIKGSRRASLTAVSVKPLAGYVAGYAVGVLLFLAVSVAPNPRDYFRTAALARLSAADSSADLNLSATMDRSKLIQTFVSPEVIVAKEVARYQSVAAGMRWWEALLWLGALPAFLLIRKQPANAPNLRALMIGAVIGGGIVFNGSSLLYLSAILPFFVPALASLITHGFSSRPRLQIADVRSFFDRADRVGTGDPSLGLLANRARARTPSPA